MLTCRQRLELMRHIYNEDLSLSTPEAKGDIFQYLINRSNPKLSLANLLPSRLVLGRTTHVHRAASANCKNHFSQYSHSKSDKTSTYENEFCIRLPENTPSHHFHFKKSFQALVDSY